MDNGDTGFEVYPKATHQGTLMIGDVAIPCFVLEDSTRVISGRGMTKAIGMKGRGQGVTRIPTHRTLKPFINEALELAIKNPIYFVGVGSRSTKPTAGYEATILLQVCEVVLNARDAGQLKTEQEIRYAQYCDTLIRAFAKVGVVALIDEATGFQEVRDRLALQKILEKYIREDLARWAKTFPDEFYEELFRLRGWQYRPLTVKRPSVVGHWTNDIVYSRLAPGVLDALREKNPVNENGRRPHKHFQYLTDEHGHPKLKEHLSNVIFLMKGSANWQSFYRVLQRSAPKLGETPELHLEHDDDR
jgi:P63C domain